MATASDAEPSEDSEIEPSAPFMWGVTSSSVQIEGVHPAADWSRWERDKAVPASSDGNGFATNFHDDFALLAGLGLTDVRLTIEWARVEPVEGKVDTEALDRYRDIVDHAAQVGLRPWLTLHNTSLPGWFSEDTKGFLDERGRAYHWLRHVDRCAEGFADVAAGWVPIEDPVGWALRGYGLGSRPPGKRSSTELGHLTLLEAIEGALLADHIAARHLRAGGATTMAVRGTPTIFKAVDDERSEQESRAAAEHVRWWSAALFDSWIQMAIHGELALPERRAQRDPAWVEDFDLIGLAFDHPMALDHQGKIRAYPASAPRSDAGFSPLPEELGVLLQRMAERIDRPLVIAANGVSTRNDDWRAELLEETLQVITTAQEDGIDLRGFFIDTGIDGYEYRAGFDTERGVISRDRNFKASAHLLQNHIT